MKVNLSGLIKQARLQMAIDLVESIMKSVDSYQNPLDLKKALASLGIELVANEKEVTFKYMIPLVSFEEDFEIDVEDSHILSSFEEVKSSYVEIDDMIDGLLERIKDDINNMSEEELSQDEE